VSIPGKEHFIKIGFFTWKTLISHLLYIALNYKPLTKVNPRSKGFSEALDRSLKMFIMFEHLAKWSSMMLQSWARSRNFVKSPMYHTCCGQWVLNKSCELNWMFPFSLFVAKWGQRLMALPGIEQISLKPQLDMAINFSHEIVSSSRSSCLKCTKSAESLDFKKLPQSGSWFFRYTKLHFLRKMLKQHMRIFLKFKCNFWYWQEESWKKLMWRFLLWKYVG